MLPAMCLIGVFVGWWEAFSQGIIPGLFSSVSDMDAAIRALQPQGTLSIAVLCGSASCPLLRPMCNISDPASTAFVEEMVQAGLPSCHDGWWYSPACANNTATCVPVVLAVAAWNVINWCALFLISLMSTALNGHMTFMGSTGALSSSSSRA